MYVTWMVHVHGKHFNPCPIVHVYWKFMCSCNIVSVLLKYAWSCVYQFSLLHSLLFFPSPSPPASVLRRSATLAMCPGRGVFSWLVGQAQSGRLCTPSTTQLTWYCTLTVYPYPSHTCNTLTCIEHVHMLKYVRIYVWTHQLKCYECVCVCTWMVQKQHIMLNTTDMSAHVLHDCLHIHTLYASLCHSVVGTTVQLSGVNWKSIFPCNLHNDLFGHTCALSYMWHDTCWADRQGIIHEPSLLYMYMYAYKYIIMLHTSSIMSSLRGSLL